MEYRNPLKYEYFSEGLKTLTIELDELTSRRMEV